MRIVNANLEEGYHAGKLNKSKNVQLKYGGFWSKLLIFSP